MPISVFVTNKCVFSGYFQTFQNLGVGSVSALTDMAHMCSNCCSLETRYSAAGSIIDIDENGEYAENIVILNPADVNRHHRADSAVIKAMK